MSLLTYQVLYWGWLKLESMEMKKEKDTEIMRLEMGLKDLLKEKKERS